MALTPEQKRARLAELLRDKTRPTRPGGSCSSTSPPPSRWPWTDASLAGSDVDTVLRHLLDEGRKAGLLVPEVDLPQVRTLFEVFAGNLRALKHYVPRPIAGRVTVLRASESLPESAQAPGRGWGAFCGGLEVQEVPGNHYTTLHAPNVQVLAERLSALLYRSATGGSPSAD